MSYGDRGRGGHGGGCGTWWTSSAQGGSDLAKGCWKRGVDWRRRRATAFDEILILALNGRGCEEDEGDGQPLPERHDGKPQTRKTIEEGKNRRLVSFEFLQLCRTLCRLGNGGVFR